MISLRRVLAFLAAAAAGAALAQDPGLPAPSDFALVGVRVETGSGSTIESATVVVRNGLIESVTAGGAAPAGIAAIDGKGKVLLPGLFDAYTSRGLKAFSPPTVALRPDTNLQAFASMWEANRKGIYADFCAAASLDYRPTDSDYRSGVTASLIGLGQGGMRGSAALVAALPESASERVIAPQAAAGLSFRLAPGTGYPGNILGGIALLRQTLADAQSMKEGAELWAGQPSPPPWAAAITALQPVVKGEIPVVFEANLEREILRAIALAEEFGLRIIILGGRDAGGVAGILAAKKIPVILSAELDAEPRAPRAQADVPPADVVPDGVAQERRDRWEAQSRNAEILAAAGVPIAFSGQGGLQNLLSGVRKRVERGLPRQAALRALTAEPAAIYGVGSRLGSVEPGKAATLLLMSGDPLDPASKVMTVWVNGRRMFAEEAK